MTWYSEKSASARRSLLAVLMLAVLGASVGAAWLLNRRAAGRVRAGSQILQEIRTKGLEHFWPEKPQIDWYLIQKGTDVIGWSATARRQTSEGNFVGVYVKVVPGHHTEYEKWTLNADATVGAYFAALRLPGGKGFETTIKLTDGTVTVLQRGTGFSVTAHSPAPNNYLPEGTSMPALRQVAAEQADAQFAMVFNEKPNPGGVVEFGTLRLRYLGKGQTSQGMPVRRVRLTEVRNGKKNDVVYELDEKGKILFVSGSDGYHQAAADEKTVTRKFKDAPQYLRQLLPRVTRGGG